MNIETIQAPRGAIAVLSGGKVQITDAGAALDLAMSIRYETGISRLAIDKEVLRGDFFILSTGVAGEILQKFINYRFKAAIYGDYTGYTSKPLLDFIRESNRGRDFFWDPFCGSGTIVIEAALAALNRAPGLARKFAAQSWSCIPEDVWTQAREAARAAEFRGEYRILGTDIDSGSLAIAIANAKKAGVSKYIEFREADATRESLPCDHGVIVCNPPYGERMLDIQQAQSIYRIMGDVFPADKAHPCYIITPDADFELHFGKPANKKRKLYNGMIQCNLMSYFQ